MKISKVTDYAALMLAQLYSQNARSINCILRRKERKLLNI